MEDRIKQRLTGAAILVVLVVLVVPEMFHGQRTETAERPGAVSGPPPRSFIINLDDRSANPGPAVAPGAAPGAASVPGVATVGTGTPRRAAGAPCGVHCAAPAPVSPPMAPPGTAGWSVQLGSFSQPHNARHLMQRLSSRGVSARLVGPDGRGHYRVRTAILASRSAAAALQQRLALQGFRGVISPSQ